MSRPRRESARTCVLALAAMVLWACAAVPDRNDPVPYVDRDTGVNFVAVGRPLIFAHARPQVAARVRDYVTVAAVSMDRNGRTQYALLIYLWSTVDPRNGRVATGPAGDLVLAADDRLIPLRPIPDPPTRLPPLGRPPAPHFLAAMYGTDLPTLRFLASARYLSLLGNEGGFEARFGLWDDGRRALAEFVRSEQ